MRYANPTDRDIVEWLPHSVPDRRIRYGDDPLQFGDLRVPRHSAPGQGHPVVVVVHGGGYSPNWNLDSTAPLAERLTAECGVATWNLEYRRPGQVGGGWPGTWLDIANGIDHLRDIARPYPLDISRVIAVGHSAGATFAAWAAARFGIDEHSPLYLPNPLALRGIVSLAGILDLRREWGDGTPPRNLKALLTPPGPDPQDSQDSQDDPPALLTEMSPVELVRSIGTGQRLIVGSEDAADMVVQTRDYAAAAERAGSAVVAEFLDGANHFDLIDAGGAAWPVLARAVAGLLEGVAEPGAAPRG